jgi:hypothetical protein
VKRSPNEMHEYRHGNLTYVSTFTKVFLDQKRINVCGHTVCIKS